MQSDLWVSLGVFFSPISIFLSGVGLKLLLIHLVLLEENSGQSRHICTNSQRT